jgi:hypothetical protein
MSFYEFMRPNHALQRARRERPGCNGGVPRTEQHINCRTSQAGLMNNTIDVHFAKC